MSRTAHAYSQETETALETLRDRVAAGLAGQESFDAFLDLLETAGEGNCEELREAEAGDGEARRSEIREAIAAACPEPAGEDADGTAGAGQDNGKATPGKGGRRAELIIDRTARPRHPPDAYDAGPSIRASAFLPGASGRLTLRDYHPYARNLRLGGGRLSIQAGHLDPAPNRISFVAGGRFYAGWSGSSGIGGPLASSRAALDGLGMQARAGAWTLDAQGAWNRLAAPSGSVPAERLDASSILAGLGWNAAGANGMTSFRMQAARQRFESAAGSQAALTVAGAALEGRTAGAAKDNRAADRILWSLGAAASLVDAAVHPHREDSLPWLRRAGVYLEGSLASARNDEGAWRVELRQSGGAWANPLQSPRGYLRDTLDGRWILPGRREGGLSARSRFPVLAARGYRASLKTGGAAAWSPEALLAGEGSLAWIEGLGEWTHEVGGTLAYRGTGPPGSVGLRASENGGQELGWGGWGQSLAWKRGDWQARAALAWKGAAYSGTRPAPFSLDCAWNGKSAWSAEILTGDVREPGRYLRLEMRQAWWAESGIRVDHGLRLPWTRQGLAADMSYQLRLEAAL